MGFPCGSVGKESACNVGDLGSIPQLGKSPGQMVDSIWSISILVLPQKDYRRTKYLIAHESKHRITVKETKLIL